MVQVIGRENDLREIAVIDAMRAVFPSQAPEALYLEDTLENLVGFGDQLLRGV